MKEKLGTLAAVTGFAAAIVAILTAPSQMRSVVVVLLIAFAVVLLGLVVGPEAIRKLRASRSLPSEDEVDGLCRQYRVEQATASEITSIAELEAAVYSNADAIPEQILREWFLVNPTGFSVVRSPSGRLVGHLDILPLRPSTMDSFCRGDIVERQIRGDSLYSPSDRASITALYVESVILQPEKPMTTAAAWLCLLENIPAIVERVCDPTRIERVYAIAATPSGEKLLRKLSFTLEVAPSRREDRHALFVGHFADVERSLGRFSRRAPVGGPVQVKGSE